MNNRPFKRFNPVISLELKPVLYTFCGSEENQKARKLRRAKEEGRISTTGIKPIKVGEKS